MPMATNVCTVVLEVHVEDVTVFSSVENEYFHLFEERYIDIFSSQKLTGFWVPNPGQ